jgi:hypothetical protein
VTGTKVCLGLAGSAETQGVSMCQRAKALSNRVMGRGSTPHPPNSFSKLLSSNLDLLPIHISSLLHGLKCSSLPFLLNELLPSPKSLPNSPMSALSLPLSWFYALASGATLSRLDIWVDLIPNLCPRQKGR